MTLLEIKNQVMFQTNNDADDIVDYLPFVVNYINDGYNRLVKAWTNGNEPMHHFPPLQYDDDIPALPNWAHQALADWATWLCYRNGNPQKQNRGLYFRNAFEEIKARISDEGGQAGMNEDGSQKKYEYFRNIPT